MGIYSSLSPLPIGQGDLRFARQRLDCTKFHITSTMAIFKRPRPRKCAVFCRFDLNPIPFQFIIFCHLFDTVK